MLGQRLAIMLVPTIVLLDNSEECHEHVQKLAFKTGTFSHGNTQALAAPWLFVLVPRAGTQHRGCCTGAQCRCSPVLASPMQRVWYAPVHQWHQCTS